MASNCIAFIFARGGSKGLPRKNLHMLHGKSLLARAVATAQACPSIDRIVVSTDDSEIAGAARAAGAEVPFMRPAELASDTASEWLAWQHAVKFISEQDRFKIMVSLPTTAPLRTVEDVEACINALDSDCDTVVTVQPAARHPQFNMLYRENETGLARLFMPADKAITRRQDAQDCYDMTTVAYVTRPEFVCRSKGIFAGRVRAVVIPKERAVDIDDEWDVKVAEAYMGHTC